MEYVKDVLRIASLLLTLWLAAFGERCRTVQLRWLFWKYSGLPCRWS